LLACAHPLLQFGSVDLPMKQAPGPGYAASPLNAFKHCEHHEPAGVFRAGPAYGLMGRVHKEPQMIPVTLTINGGAGTEGLQLRSTEQSRLSPVAIMATVSMRCMV